MQHQHQLQLVMLGRRVLVKNMMKNKQRGEIRVWSVVCHASEQCQRGEGVGAVTNHTATGYYFTLKFRNDQPLQLCWPQWLLRASSTDTKHSAFITGQQSSSPYNATQAAGISPAAFCILCSFELSLCPSFCNGTSTCRDKIPFYSVTLQTTGCVLGVMSISRSNAGILESESSPWGNSSGKRKLKKVMGPG